MDYKKTNADNNTITRDLLKINEGTNVYETIVIMSKRSNQISSEIKVELIEKLDKFASYTDNLEEIFENWEQIEVSKFYEKLPKPALIAIQELIEDRIYYRRGEKQEDA